MEDQRIGSALRALRIRRRLRQVDVATAAGIPRGVVMRVEAGRLDEVSFGQVRRLARVLDARFEGLLRWRGADLDRLVNRGHALMHEAMFRWLREIGGWLAVPEVSFARNGERGVIDIVAWHAASRVLLVIELKTRIVDINDLMATMDVRRRVAGQIAEDRGWDPVAVRVWVVVAPGPLECSRSRGSCDGTSSKVPGRRSLRCGDGCRSRPETSPASVSCQKFA